MTPNLRPQYVMYVLWEFSDYVGQMYQPGPQAPVPGFPRFVLCSVFRRGSTEIAAVVHCGDASPFRFNVPTGSDYPLGESARSSRIFSLSASSGRRLNHANCSLNFSSGRAGVPQTICPLRTIFPAGIPACAPTIAPSSIRSDRPIPTCPPKATFLPIMADPEMPVCAAITVFSPMRTLCATCTRLSSFEPAWISVRSSEPRSIVVFAPISTSSPMFHFSHLREFPAFALFGYVAEAVGTDRPLRSARSRDSPGVRPHTA